MSTHLACDPPTPGPSDPLSDDQMLKLLSDLDQLKALAKVGGPSAVEAWGMGLEAVSQAEYWRKRAGMATNAQLRERMLA